MFESPSIYTDKFTARKALQPFDIPSSDEHFLPYTDLCEKLQ